MNEELLKKSKIGEYIGGKDNLNKEVLSKYTSLFNFKGCTFEEALRSYLKGFRLPGEAQMIDRIMDHFAKSGVR